MRKIIKITSVTIGILVGLILVSALILPEIIDLNKYKDKIYEQVKEYTNRKIEIGDIKLSTFTGLGAKIKGLQIAENPAFGNQNFLRLGTAEVKIAFFSYIFSGKIDIRKIYLDDIDISITRNREGNFNFDDLKSIGQREKKVEKTPEQEAEDQRKIEEFIKSLKISKMALNNIAIKFTDHAFNTKDSGDNKEVIQPPLELVIDDLDIETKDVAIDSAIPFSIKARIMPAEKQNFIVNGSVGPLSSTNPNLKLEASLESLEMSQYFKIAKIPVTAESPKLSVNLKIDMPSVNNTNIQAKLDMLSKSGLKGILQTDLSMKEKEIKGVLSLKDFAVKTPLLASEVHDTNADIEFTQVSADIKSFLMHIGDSDISLTGNVSSFSPLNATYAIESNLLDIDKILVPSKKPKEEKKENSHPLEGKTLSGTVKVKKLESRGLNINNLDTKISIANEVIGVEKIALGIFSGSLFLNGKVNMSSEQPVFNLNLNVNKLQVNSILSKYTPFKDSLYGHLSASINNISGSGMTANTIKRTLSLSSKIKLEDGKIMGMNVVKKLAEYLHIENLVPASSGMETAFRTLDGGFDVKKEKIYSDNLKLDAKVINIYLDGFSTLNGDLNYKCKAIFPESISSKVPPVIGKYLKNKQGLIEVPFALKGTLTSPSVELDTKTLKQLAVNALKNEVKEKIKSEASKLIDKKLKGKAGEKAKDVLKKFF